MKLKITAILLTLLVVMTGTLYSAPDVGENGKIQIAILLDTSSSMDGLIEQAKSQLWKIVNELAAAERNGKIPKLEVALFEYGKSSIPQGEGYMRMITSFTNDLDKISGELFALTTNGGDEYCGQAIDSATRNLKWDKDTGSLKLIFIAGNEPFNQGELNYVEAGRKAAVKGIVVNTIFCGDKETGVATYWKHGADITGGKYINIDMNRRVQNIVAPQDAEIARLNAELNSTYVAYGRKGKEKKLEQEKQDSNAKSMSGASSTDRAISKASAHYRNSSWDILDAVKDKTVDLDKMESEELPDEMKGMNAAERKEYVANMEKKRGVIREKINRLNKERRVYLDKAEKEQKGDETLDTAIIKTVREQASEKKFRFKE